MVSEKNLEKLAEKERQDRFGVRFVIDEDGTVKEIVPVETKAKNNQGKITRKFATPEIEALYKKLLKKESEGHGTFEEDQKSKSISYCYSVDKNIVFYENGKIAYVDPSMEDGAELSYLSKEDAELKEEALSAIKSQNEKKQTREL